MPLDPIKIAMAMSSGLSAVCSTCTRYWGARDKGIPGDKCLSTTGCGSPLAGDTFTDYDGPMKGSLHLWCFVCGEKSKFGIRVKGKLNIIGACERHITYVKELEAVGGEKGIHPEVRGSNGKPPGALQRPKKDLLSTIQEVEASYAEKEGG